MKTKDYISTASANTQWGAASSAGKMNRLVGAAGRSSAWLWVQGEGWVRWTELQAQVAAAFIEWQARRSVAGMLPSVKKSANCRSQLRAA
jgi:hypothetical protein